MLYLFYFLCIRAFPVLPPLFDGRVSTVNRSEKKYSSACNLTIEVDFPKEAPIDGDTGCGIVDLFEGGQVEQERRNAKLSYFVLTS